MCKLAGYTAVCLTLFLLNLSSICATTLTGYAIRPDDPFAQKKMPRALVEFKDASTGLPAHIKIKTGLKIDGRKDALLALSTGDIGKWEADVKPGVYIVSFRSVEDPSQSYSLNLNATLTTCTTTTGYLDVMACGATGSSSGDDTQAIIDGVSAIAAAGGGKLFFPKGFYNVGTTAGTAALLPISLPSGITIEGVNGGLTGTDYGNSRITLISSSDPTGVYNKAVFKIGGNKRHITMRDIHILGYNAPNPGISIPGSTGILAEGNNPDSTLAVLFSNMTIWGFDVGIDVKPCTKDHIYQGNCKENPSNPNSPWMIPWQFDQVKADHVSFGNKIGVRMDTEDTDWNFSSCGFSMQADFTPANQTPATSGIHIMRGGFIQISNSFGGAAGPNPGGNFIMVGMVGTLQIINSQAEGIKNSIVFGRDAMPGEEGQDLGSTGARIVVMGSEFGAPIKLRHRVTYVSTGNHYDYNTIQTSTPLVRVYSTGDKFCGDGFIPNNAPCPNPGVGGPGTVVFATGFPSEISLDPSGSQTAGSIQEVPNRFGLRTVFSKEVEAGGKVKATGDLEVTVGSGNGPLLNVNSWNFGVPLMRLGQNYYYDFSRSGDNGFLQINGNQGVPFKGVTLNGLLQLDPNMTYNDLVSYGTTIFNGQPVIKDGAIMYCKDCAANSSTGECMQGTTSNGALAKRINGIWKCN